VIRELRIVSLERDRHGGGVRIRRAPTVAVALLLGVMTGCLLSACWPGGGAAEPSASTTALADRDDANGGGDTEGAGGREDSGVDGDSESVPEIPFEEVMNGPESHMGERIRVTGNVFFFPVCPPPGAANARCTLLGYLAGPEQRTFTSADTNMALPLSEMGVRVGCDESGAARPACPGWTADATYTLEGVVKRQVLGGRETSLVHFDVVEKGTPYPW
jgi:hypothetical protein